MGIEGLGLRLGLGFKLRKKGGLGAWCFWGSNGFRFPVSWTQGLSLELWNWECYCLLPFAFLFALLCGSFWPLGNV